jgi:hypothetical protein
VTETVFALAKAEDVPFTIVGGPAPWLMIVDVSGADDADA